MIFVALNVSIVTEFIIVNSNNSKASRKVIELISNFVNLIASILSTLTRALARVTFSRLTSFRCTVLESAILVFVFTKEISFTFDEFEIQTEFTLAFTAVDPFAIFKICRT